MARLELENYPPHEGNLGKRCQFWRFDFGCSIKGFPELKGRRGCTGFIDPSCIQIIYSIDTKFEKPSSNLTPVA